MLSPEQQAWLDSIQLEMGTHKAGMGYCDQEAAAYLAEEEHSDAPDCVSATISALRREINDGCHSEIRQWMKKSLAATLGTHDYPENEIGRMFLCADAVCRVFVPTALRAIGLTEEAGTLSLGPAIYDTPDTHGYRDLLDHTTDTVCRLHTTQQSNGEIGHALDAVSYAIDVLDYTINATKYNRVTRDEFWEAHVNTWATEVGCSTGLAIGSVACVVGWEAVWPDIEALFDELTGALLGA